MSECGTTPSNNEIEKDGAEHDANKTEESNVGLCLDEKVLILPTLPRGKVHAGTCKLPRPRAGASQDDNKIEGSDVGLYQEKQISRLIRSKVRVGALKPPRPIGDGRTEGQKRKLNDQPSIQPRRRRRKGTAENAARSLVEEILKNVGDTIGKKTYDGSKVGKFHKFHKFFKPETPEIKKMQFKRKMNKSLVGKTLKGGKSKTGNVKKITEYFEGISKQNSIVGGRNYGRVGPEAITATTNIANGMCGGEGDARPGKGLGVCGPVELRASYDVELEDYCG